MGTPVVTNIITGGAWLYYAPVGEAIPDETSIDYGEAWGGNWARVGFTKAPLALSYEVEEMEVEVEEFIGPLKRIKTKEGFMLETTLAELTSAYLAFVFSSTAATTAAGASQRGFDEVKVGGEVFTDEYAWGFEGAYIDAAGVKFPVRAFFYKATAVMNGSLTFSKRNGEYTGIPIQIKALVDPTQTEGENMFHFQRVTAEATS